MREEFSLEHSKTLAMESLDRGSRENERPGEP
jgi:hypothetical protein